MKTRKKQLYGAKYILGWYEKNARHAHTYEERVVLIKAIDTNEAVKLAEENALSYANAVSGDNEIVKYENFVDIYEIATTSLRHGYEVYSITRNNIKGLNTKKFLDRYYDDGTQNTRMS